MAIQTQGFQFQNLARYTPVDPTLVGVDFSRIGSGIADAMKLGSSLQQYQMRKQAMEEEAATRESRIAQANAAARYLTAQANAQLAADIATKEATAKAAKLGAEVPIAQLAGETAKGELVLLPSTLEAKRLGTQLNIDQTRQNLSMVETLGNLQRLETENKINAAQFYQSNADVFNKLGMSQKQLESELLKANIFRAEAGGFQDLATGLKALTPGQPKAPNYLGMINSLENQIQHALKEEISYDGVKTNFASYIEKVGLPGQTKQEGFWGFKKDVPRSPVIDAKLEEINKLQKVKNFLNSAQLNAYSFGDQAPSGSVRPPTLGEARQTGLPSYDQALSQLAQSMASRLGGVASRLTNQPQAAVTPTTVTPPTLGETGETLPALADLINASVTTPTAGVVTGAAAAPAAAQGPAATMEIKDGKVVPVKSVMERAEGATQKAIEFAKDKPASAILAAAAAKKVIPPAVKLTGSALKTLLSYTPETIAGARTLANRATPALAANEILGSFIRTDEKPSEETGLEIGPFKTKFGAGSAVPRIARLIAQSIYAPEENIKSSGYEAAKRMQDEIEGLSEEIKSIGRSNLTAAEKIAQINPLREQMGELIKQSMAGKYASVRSVPSASGGIPVVSPGGTALLFPGITASTEELTGPLVESDRVSSNTPIKVVDLEVVLRERPAGPWSEAEIRAINKAREEGTLPVIAYDNNFRINFARQNAPQIMDRLPVIGR